MQHDYVHSTQQVRDLAGVQLETISKFGANARQETFSYRHNRTGIAD